MSAGTLAWKRSAWSTSVSSSSSPLKTSDSSRSMLSSCERVWLPMCLTVPRKPDMAHEWKVNERWSPLLRRLAAAALLYAAPTVFSAPQTM